MSDYQPQKHFCPECRKDLIADYFKDVNNKYEMFNTGMQHRFNESGEYYPISSGSDTSQNIAPSIGNMYSADYAKYDLLIRSSIRYNINIWRLGRRAGESDV